MEDAERNAAMQAKAEEVHVAKELEQLENAKVTPDLIAPTEAEWIPRRGPQ